MLKVISVVGARPNFIKIAPVHKAFQKYNGRINHLICHTGQHFDEVMSKVFFDELEMPRPDFYLGVGGGSHAEQTARIMTGFEKVLLEESPDLVIVPGDVNSTLAATLAATKLHIPVAHVESGLRSFDKAMPEEINRIVADHLSDLLFVTEQSGLDNLKREGVPDEKVFFTGNVMIDSLVSYLPKIIENQSLVKYSLDAKNYIVCTFHRPSNVDDPEKLHQLMDFLNRLTHRRKVVFPVHPRTKANLKGLSNSNLTFAGKFSDGKLTRNGERETASEINNSQPSAFSSQLILTEPLGYLDFLSLVSNAELVITDSGGIQEETTFLGVQCLTARNSTERPVTVNVGTNQLMGTDFRTIEERALEVLNGKIKEGGVPPLWDGHAAERVAEIIVDRIGM